MENSKCIGQTRTTGRGWSLLRASRRSAYLGSSRVTRWIIRGLLLVVFGWGQIAFSADYTYYFYVASGGAGTGPYGSANSACLAGIAYNADNSTNTQHAFESLNVRNDTLWSCIFTFKDHRDQPQRGLYDIRRFGDSCGTGTYDPSIGDCVAPEEPEEDKCLATYGKRLEHEHYLGPIILGVFPKEPPPSAVCQASCQYDDPTILKQPYRYNTGTPPGAFTLFEYFGNGQECTAGDVEASAPGAGEAKTDKANECTNRVCLTTDQNGSCQQYTYSCSSTEVHTEPATDCDFGSVNGESVCVPNSPGPTLVEKDVKTEVEEKLNSDGSKDTTTTTTTTTTNCNGVGACSSTTTTNVSNNKTNADGSSGGESSTCTGPDCKDPSGKSPNDKKQDQEQKEENESKVSGDASCAAVPVCTGDAIQCAILRQTHTQRCADEKFQEVDAEELVAGVAGDMAGEEYQPFGEGERGTFDLSGMIDTSSTIGGSCPVLPPISFTMKGVTKSVEFGTVMAEICKYASWFSYLMVAFAMRRAAEIVAGGMA